MQLCWQPRPHLQHPNPQRSQLMTSRSDGQRFHQLGDEQRDEIIQRLDQIITLLTPPQSEPDNKTVPIARGVAARSRKKKDAQP